MNAIANLAPWFALVLDPSNVYGVVGLATYTIRPPNSPPFSASALPFVTLSLDTWPDRIVLVVREPGVAVA